MRSNQALSDEGNVLESQKSGEGADCSPEIKGKKTKQNNEY